QRRPVVVADFAPGSKVEGITVLKKTDDANRRSLALVYDNDPAVTPFTPSEWSLCTLSWPIQ
ncbi:MAG: hypothetical protein Q7S00_03755, partial [bacterium]|nr:hypothetical protein [bacterium]